MGRFKRTTVIDSIGCDADACDRSDTEFRNEVISVVRDATLICVKYCNDAGRVIASIQESTVVTLRLRKLAKACNCGRESIAFLA